MWSCTHAFAERSLSKGSAREKPIRRPKLDAYTPIIDQILETDLALAKKQRHTAQRIFERLRDEHDLEKAPPVTADLEASMLWRPFANRIAGSVSPSETRDARSWFSGTPRPARLRSTARRWFVGVCVGLAWCAGEGREVFAQTPPSVGQDVCARTFQVSAAIVTASGAATCAQVTLRHMREITSLDLSDQVISSLSVGDFDGLVRLDTLDLTFNVLTALPQGVFDELLLLKTLRLDGNRLQSLPVYLFDELLLLEELTLADNPLLSLPDGMFGEFSRFDGMQANGDPPDDSGSFPKIQRFLDRHSVTSPEAFIAALPAVYRQRFAMVYASEAPAQPHVSEDFPRIVSWGGDGRFTFAWNTDASAPAELGNVVEFLRQGDDRWSAGVIDFSGGTPSVTEPSSCQVCHGSLNKPLWGAWNTWDGTEFVSPGDTNYDSVAASTAAATESTNPRIEPLDFSVSHDLDGNWARRHLKAPGHGAVALAVQEAGTVWSWRHAEVLHRRLKAGEDDYWRFAETVMCEAKRGPEFARHKVTVDSFPLSDHNLAVPATPGSGPIHTDETLYDALSNPYALPDYHYDPGGEMGSAVSFLIAVDLWQREPIIRKLYRDVSNADTLLPEQSAYVGNLLYYPSGSTTAEDELLQKLRVHFGEGGRGALAARGRWNSRSRSDPKYWSASFFDGLLEVMAPRMCDALTKTRPTNLEVALTEGDAVLSWDPPEDAGSLTGYRILRGVGGETPTVYVADTDTTYTTWTDNSPAPGDYGWIVQALFDGYPSPESNPARASVLGLSGPVRNLSAVMESGSVTLSWEPPEGDAPVTGYRMLRGEALEALQVLVADTGSTATSHVDTTVTADETYFYSVAALNGQAEGPSPAVVRVGPSAPEVVGPTSFTVVEGETAVGTLSATDTGTPASDLVWSISGGADSGHFALSASGVLTFAAAKDYEAPDDAGADGTYDLTAQVSDGAGDATADISVSLSNRNEAPTADAGADQPGVEQGATVTLRGSGRDPDAGDTLQYAWTQTGGATVTLSAPSAAVTTFAAPAGPTEDAALTFRLRVTDAGGLSGEDGATVTVVAAEAPQEPALTASFHAMPASHDRTPFTFELRFSEELDLSYVTLRDSAFTVTNGRVTVAQRLNAPSNLRWEITVAPTPVEDITIVLRGGQACDARGAICTLDGRPLTGSLVATVTRPSNTLAASFYGVPAEHDGETPFTFELWFNEEPDLSYVTVRDSAFTVTNGRVTVAQRYLRMPSNLRWEITVQPTSAGDITIVLPGGRACDARGAICTLDGRRLTGSVQATVRLARR